MVKRYSPDKLGLFLYGSREAIGNGCTTGRPGLHTWNTSGKSCKPGRAGRLARYNPYITLYHIAQRTTLLLALNQCEC